ncbi:MAG: TetR/AcrR family transcriptional regulator [Nocardioidaceae bacterium]|nr:TetR/AcrR family transcriptional regulator [Nocardioidaceae bacterium]
MTGQEVPSPHLPKGPHHLSRAEVAASQRTRLLEATLQVVGTQGYAALSISQITAAARVSRTAFYEQFTGKQDAFLQAYDSFAETFADQLMTVSSRASSPWEAIESSTQLLVGWLTERPAAARAWLLEVYAAGDAGLEHRAMTMRSVERAFDLAARWIRKVDPDLPPLPRFAARAVVAASFELLTDAVRDPSPRRIRETRRTINELWLLGITAPRYEPPV